MDEETVRRIVFDAIQIAVTQIAAAVTSSDAEAEAKNAADISPFTLTSSINTRWNAHDLRFFDLNYDDKTIYIVVLIEHTNKNTYFRNIHLFLDRVKQFIPIKGVKLVRENL